MGRFWKVLCAVLIGAAAVRAQQYDVIIRGGTLYDGTGCRPHHGGCCDSGRPYCARGKT